MDKKLVIFYMPILGENSKDESIERSGQADEDYREDEHPTEETRICCLAHRFDEGQGASLAWPGHVTIASIVQGWGGA